MNLEVVGTLRLPMIWVHKQARGMIYIFLFLFSPSYESNILPKQSKGRVIMILIFLGILGPLHTWDWEPVTITLQALSLAEKAEPVQVRFTLRLRDQQSI
jgi:hypothetical protein